MCIEPLKFHTHWYADQLSSSTLNIHVIWTRICVCWQKNKNTPPVHNFKYQPVKCRDHALAVTHHATVRTQLHNITNTYNKVASSLTLCGTLLIFNTGWLCNMIRVKGSGRCLPGFDFNKSWFVTHESNQALYSNGFFKKTEKNHKSKL